MKNALEARNNKSYYIVMLITSLTNMILVYDFVSFRSGFWDILRAALWQHAPTRQ